MGRWRGYRDCEDEDRFLDHLGATSTSPEWNLARGWSTKSPDLQEPFDLDADMSKGGAGIWQCGRSFASDGPDRFFLATSNGQRAYAVENTRVYYIKRVITNEASPSQFSEVIVIRFPEKLQRYCSRVLS